MLAKEAEAIRQMDTDMEEALSFVSMIRARNLPLSLSLRSSQSTIPTLYTSSVSSARRGCAQIWSQCSSTFL